MEFGIEKYAMLIMKSDKRYIMEDFKSFKLLYDMSRKRYI